MGRVVAAGLGGHPFVLPVFGAICLLVAVCRLVGRAAGRPADPALLAYALAIGLLVSVTLTPAGQDPAHAHWCLPQWPRTGFGLWAANPERRWNVLLGIPLGAATGWLVVRRRAAVAVPALVMALVLPELIELGQAALPLGRTCAVLDAVDNTSGVLIGLAAGVLTAAVRALVQGSVRSRPRRT